MPIGLLMWTVVFLSGASPNLQTRELIQKSRSTYQAVIFLSHKCPCSKGHIKHLNQLAREHSDVEFYGVISEPVTLKNKSAVEAYFTADRFAFPIVRDEEQMERTMFCDMCVAPKPPGDGHGGDHGGGRH